MTQPLHVVHLSHPLTCAGAQNTLLQIVRRTRNCKHTIVTPHPDGDVRAREFVAAGADITHTAAPYQPRDYDIVHVHNYEDARCMEWASLADPVPILVSRHGPHELPGLWSNIPHREAHVWADPSFEMSVPNGCDFSAIPERTGVGYKVAHVTTCSRFAQWKRPDLFIETCRLLNQAHPGKFRFFFVGGDESEPWHDAMREAMSGLVQWMPQCEHRVALAIMRMSHVFVLTSVDDTRPLCLMEARAMGLHTVATNVNGIPTIPRVRLVSKEAGASEWADAILESPGVGADDRPEESGSVLMVRRYETLYRELVGRMPDA